MWSEIKQALRSFSPGTHEELLVAAGLAFDTISTTGCLGFFLHARYAI